MQCYLLSYKPCTYYCVNSPILNIQAHTYGHMNSLEVTRKFNWCIKTSFGESCSSQHFSPSSWLTLRILLIVADTSELIRFLYFFSLSLFLFLVFVSVWEIRQTYVGFWVHVKNSFSNRIGITRTLRLIEQSYKASRWQACVCHETFYKERNVSVCNGILIGFKT